MRPARSYALPLLAAGALCTLDAPARGQDAAEGALGRLACRVVDAKPAVPGLEACVLTVEVRNGSSQAVEPVAFELRGRPPRGGGPAETRVVRRMPDPVHGRAGRLVPPGGTLTYPLAVGADPRTLAGASVRVTKASFPEAAGVPKSPVEVGKVATERVPDLVGVPVWETRIEARNALDVPVDAVFLALCEEPAGGRILVRRRFAPRERAVWTLREERLALDAADAPTRTGLAVRRLTPVDWSAVVDDGPPQALALLTAAWSRWHRWEEPLPRVQGRFRADLPVEGAPDPVAGTFDLDATGEGTFEPASPISPEVRQALERTLRDAFADLRRPAAERALPSLAPTLVERAGPRARVRCAAPLVGGRGPEEVHDVEDGILRGWEPPEAGTGIREVWTTQAHGEGYLVTSRDLYQRAVGGGTRPCDTRRWEYAAVEGRVVPRRYARAEWYVGDRARETRLDLLDLTFPDVARPADAPAAPDAVRAAWDAPYRYPRGPVTLRARFVAENPGTDAIWGGVRRVSGRLALRGFVGMRGPGRSWKEAHVTLDGTWRAEQHGALAAAFEDRLWIWAHRDFGGRDDFDVAFRGARIAPRAGAVGVYDVTNGPCTTLTIRDGRIVAWDPPTLLAGELGYGPLGAGFGQTSLRAGAATSTVSYVDAGGGWWIPATMRFERVLDATWGPETVTLTEVVVAPEEAR